MPDAIQHWQAIAEQLLESGRWAPSGDNTQPWQFAIDVHKKQIVLHTLPARDPSPMNTGGRMSRIAAGTALENILRTAAENGCSVDFGIEDSRIVISFGDFVPGKIGIDPIILSRATNRRVYNGQPVTQETIRRLAQRALPVDGTETYFISERRRVEQLAEHIQSADTLMLGEASMRDAFLANVRFDSLPDAAVDQGLSLASLEARAPDRIALNLLRRLPHGIIKMSGVIRALAKHSRKLASSASGFCLIVSSDPSSTPRADFLVGRTLQRAWLALANEQLAVQPMMSQLVLENALDNGPEQLVQALGTEQLEILRQHFRKIAPEIGSGRPAALMRFGYAPPPSGRTGRLNLSELMPGNRESP